MRDKGAVYRGKKSSRMDPPHYQKYGVPIYGASWAPEHITKGANKEDGDFGYIVLAGGGGEGCSGIPNNLLLVRFDFASNSLSSNPIARLETDKDLPYRMVVNPSGRDLVCSFPKSCRLFEWNDTADGESDSVGVKPSEKVLSQLEDVDQQLALAFDKKGCILATGGEDGKLRVFRWPSMERILYEEEAYNTLKDLDLSFDGKLLVSVGNRGICRVWDVPSAKVATTLQKQNNEIFGFGRFSRNDDGNEVLYTTTMHEKGGNIIAWNSNTWKRMCSKRVVSDPISAVSASDDGRLLAIGTIQGDIVVIKSSTLQLQMIIKKAHLGLVTTLAFSHDTRALVSASMDSSARVTMIEERRHGFNYWVIILVAVIAVVIYLAKTRGIIP